MRDELMGRLIDEEKERRRDGVKGGMNRWGD